MGNRKKLSRCINNDGAMWHSWNKCKRIVIGRKDYNGKLSKKSRTKFGGITETKRASKQDEKKIGNIMGSDCNYSMSSSFSYKLFYPENQGTYIGWVILIVGALLFVPYFLKYYKVEIKLK